MKTLPLHLLFLLLPLASQAQSDTTRLRAVEVTATPIPTALPRVGRHLQVIDSLGVHGNARSEVGEVLRNSTLVDVRQRGPFDAQTDIGLRGGTFDQALVLVDGIPMTDPQTGHHLMDLPIVTDAIDRVEVLYGGASRTFGAGAFSGAVNVITRAPRDMRGQLTLDGGAFGSYRARVLQDVLLGRTGLRVAGMLAHTDGYVRNSDLDHRAVQLEAGRTFGRYRLRVQAGHVHKRFGAQNFYSSLYPDQQEIVTTNSVSAELRHAGDRWSWTARAYGRQHDDRFELFRESDGWYRFDNGYFIRGEADTARFGRTAFYTFHNRHRTDVAGAEAQVKRTWKAGITSFGAHGRYEHIFSNVLGRPLSAPRAAAGGRDPFTRADERRNLALTVDHRYDRGRWTLDAGALLNLSSAFTPEWAPGLDAVYRWSEVQSTYVSAGRSFRFPTWTDLYYNRGGAVGSLDLAPEHADQLEVGHRRTWGAFSGKVALWRRQGRDLIDWVVLPGSTITQAANLTEVDLNGVEVEATLTRAKGRGGMLYAYQWTDRTGFPFRSLYVLDHLTHNAVAWWQQDLGKGFRVQVNATWRARYGTYARFSDGAAVAYPDPVRLDLRADRTFGRLTLFLGCYNLLDAEQMDRGNVPLPGRWLNGGLQVRWGAADQPARP